FAEVLTPKRQELLHELVPVAPLVAMLVNPTAAQTRSELRDVQAAADRIGQQVRIFNVSSDREIDAALATIVEQRIGGLIVQTDQFFTIQRDQLVLLTTRHAIPTIFGWREFAVAGGLMSYGTSLRAAYRQVAIYAGRILKGENPLICRSSRRPRSRQWSISEPPKRSVSQFRPRSCCAPTRSSNDREDEAPRVHHAARRRGGSVAARGARAAAGDAGDWVTQRQID